jgi:flagellar protein FliL
MATAAAAVDAAVAGDAAPKKGKKKLIIIIVAVLLVALLGGGAAVFMMKKKAAEAAAAAEEEGDGDAPAAAAEKRKDHAKHPPVFVPLEPFVVNLADKEADRFAQIGITLEVEDAKFAEEMKAYMPAIRNGILMVLSHKTSAQLLSREGKLALAREIMRESVLPLGIEVSVEKDADAAADEGNDEDAPKPKKRKKKAAAVENPVKHVHFSNFIVQ